MTDTASQLTGDWQRSTDCVSSEVEDSLVILDITNGEYVALNETAAAIWHLIETPTSLDAIVEALRASYAIEAEECSRAVGNTLTMLRDKGLARNSA